MDRTHALDMAPNDKTSLRMYPTGPEAQVAFLERLTSDERNALKQLKTEEPELCADWPDSFLMKFIWARKLDVNRAISLLKDHLVWRKEWDLDNLSVEGVRTYLRSGLSYWVPGLYTKQGYSASFIIPRNLNLPKWKEVGSRGLIHATYFMTDLASDHDFEIAREGTVLVQDFSGASWNDLLATVKGDAEFDMAKLIDSAQNHMPSRIRAIILVNPPWYVRVLLAIVKPLLKSEMRKKIHSCKSSELGNYFTPDNLLESFGGTRKFDLDEWTDKVLEARPIMSEGRYLDPAPRSEEVKRKYTGAPEKSTSKATLSSMAKGKANQSKAEAHN